MLTINTTVYLLHPKIIVKKQRVLKKEEKMETREFRFVDLLWKWLRHTTSRAFERVPAFVGSLKHTPLLPLSPILLSPLCVLSPTRSHSSSGCLVSLSCFALSSVLRASPSVAAHWCPLDPHLCASRRAIWICICITHTKNIWLNIAGAAHFCFFICAPLCGFFCAPLLCAFCARWLFASWRNIIQ